MTTRRRGSEDSRSRLLEAATRLFADHGYEQTTVRLIGERADVDPTLIARYFGSKAALYVEALRPDKSTDKPVELASLAAVQRFLDRIAPKGPTPALHAAIRPHADPELQSTAMSLLRNQLLDPLEHRATDYELDNPRLRAELDPRAELDICTESGVFGVVIASSVIDGGVRVRVFTSSLGGHEDSATGGAVIGVEILESVDGVRGDVMATQGPEDRARRGHPAVRMTGPFEVALGGEVRTLMDGRVSHGDPDPRGPAGEHLRWRGLSGCPARLHRQGPAGLPGRRRPGRWRPLPPRWGTR